MNTPTVAELEAELEVERATVRVLYAALRDAIANQQGEADE